MKLSTRARYGTRAILELALSYGKGIITLHDIAQKQDISERYLERVMSTLVSAGIVTSSRGQNGGFCLAKPPREIQLGQVVEVVEGPIAPVLCVDNPKWCKRSGICITRDIWGKLKKAMIDVLNSITLQDMIEMQKEKLAKTKEKMYHI